MPGNPTSFPDLPSKVPLTIPHLNGPAPGAWNPNVSEEELEEAKKTERYLLILEDMVVKDKAYLTEIHKWRRAELQPLITKTRNAILGAHRRIAARKRQIKYHTKLLKKRLAFDKIKKLRKEINKI